MKTLKNDNFSIPKIIDYKFAIIGTGKDRFLETLYLADKIQDVKDLRIFLSNKIEKGKIIQSFKFEIILDCMNQMKQILGSDSKDLFHTDFQKNKDYVTNQILRNRKRIVRILCSSQQSGS